jgi:hypothetical protein
VGTTPRPIGSLGLLISLLAGAVVLQGASPARGGFDAAPLRVLFVGNSLTTSNDLPAEVARLASASGRRLDHFTVAYPGFSLEDHWSYGASRTVLENGRWDVVVMQQGPSSLPESREHLRVWTARFAEAAREAGARPALLTVWPELARRSAITDVAASYRLAAEAAGAELFPAGEAWLAAWRCGLRPSLYGPDGFHPGRLGTYEAALVVYGGLFRAPVRAVRLYAPGEKPRTARLLQAAAAKALGRRLPPGRRCG